MQKKIYYHDTDCGGVVYYANYLKYLEEARTEYMLERGIDLKSLTERGIVFVVKNVNIEYKFPARYGDILTIATHNPKVKSVSMEFYQEVKKDERLIVQAKTTLASIDKNFGPAPVPEEIVRALIK